MSIWNIIWSIFIIFVTSRGCTQIKCVPATSHDSWRHGTRPKIYIISKSETEQYKKLTVEVLKATMEEIHHEAFLEKGSDNDPFSPENSENPLSFACMHARVNTINYEERRTSEEMEEEKILWWCWTLREALATESVAEAMDWTCTCGVFSMRECEAATEGGLYDDHIERWVCVCVCVWGRERERELWCALGVWIERRGEDEILD